MWGSAGGHQDCHEWQKGLQHSACKGPRTGRVANGPVAVVPCRPHTGLMVQVREVALGLQVPLQVAWEAWGSGSCCAVCVEGGLADLVHVGHDSGGWSISLFLGRYLGGNHHMAPWPF